MKISISARGKAAFDLALLQKNLRSAGYGAVVASSDGFSENTVVYESKTSKRKIATITSKGKLIMVSKTDTRKEKLKSIVDETLKGNNMQISISTDLASESRRRGKPKGKNKRSVMLRMIMPHLSQETGDRLADAIDNKKVGLFKKTWDKVKEEIAAKLSRSESSEEGMQSVSSMEELQECYTELMLDIETRLADNAGNT